jgi:hypothetical protein
LSRYQAKIVSLYAASAFASMLYGNVRSLV